MPNVDRLYKSFQPTHYDLQIEPSISTLTFTGHLLLTGILSKAAKQIVLHSRGLRISGVSAGNLKASAKPRGKDEITLQFANTLPKGEISIRLTFSGTIKDNMHGLYVCSFKTKGRTQRMLATQLEADHAREVFPCIDEPEAKA